MDDFIPPTPTTDPASLLNDIREYLQSSTFLLVLLVFFATLGPIIACINHALDAAGFGDEMPLTGKLDRPLQIYL